MTLGIIFGLASALCMSVAYLCAVIFTRTCHKGIPTLMSFAHMIMGCFALILTLFLWPAQMLPFRTYAPSLFCTSGFFLLGQTCLFIGLKASHASRISPLLGIKVFILALISLFFLKQDFSSQQWIAVILSALAAVMLTQSGGKLSWQCIAWILTACLFYCLSDLGIASLVKHFSYLGLTQAPILSCSLAYIVCGLFGLAGFVFLKDRSIKLFICSIPYSVVWFAGMLFLFVCFGAIGVVFGNIVQSTRGIISIVLGVMVAYMGFEKLEEKISRKVFIKRLCAATLMSLAIILDYLGT